MSSAADHIQHVTVVGGGLMGSGIAQFAAQNGFNVTLVDLDASLLAAARKNIEKNLERVAKKLYKDDTAKAFPFIQGALSRIKTVTDVRDAVRHCDIVIEAIVENLSAKQKLFASIDEIAAPSTIFASNTSSIPIKEIAKSTKRLDRFIGLHFFNPVPVMKLLEVIKTPETSEATYTTSMEFGKKLGKTCVTCKDTPGFLVNRLLVPYTSEALRMLERGDATARDIDIAMKLGAGYPMGPFELGDLVGLDTMKSVRETYARYEPDNPLFKEPSALLEKLVKEGKLGLKTGEGFYKYT